MDELHGEPQRRLARVVEEGTRLARAPAASHLRWRARRRRHRYAAAATMVSIVAVGAAAALPGLLGALPTRPIPPPVPLARPPAATTPTAPTTPMPPITPTPTLPRPTSATSLASLVVSPQRIAAGTAVRLTGQGWPPNTLVDFDLDGATLGSVHSDAHGAFISTVHVPGRTRPGSYHLRAACRSAHGQQQVASHATLVVTA